MTGAAPAFNPLLCVFVVVTNIATAIKTEERFKGLHILQMNSRIHSATDSTAMETNEGGMQVCIKKSLQNPVLFL